jgi:hypothetical protein
MMGRRRFLVALAFVLASIDAVANYRDSYRDGRRAYQSARYADAEALFRAALREQSTEAARAIASEGGFRDSYLPHFYLGAALAQQRKCGEARSEFAKSLSQRVLQSSREYQAYPRLAGACPDTGQSETAAPLIATETSERTPPIVRSVGAPSPSPAITDMQASTPPAQLETTTTTAGHSSVLVVPTPGASASPPPALFDAFDLLVRGRYSDTLAVLNRISDQRPRVRGEVLLLRAAAEFSLFELEGRIRPSLEATARADAVAARRLLPHGRITLPEAFSPKFRRFLADAK